jgi:RNA polymerase sigma-70 factor (ECF subfamily)
MPPADLDRLYDSEFANLCLFAAHLLGSTQDARDVVQNAFIKALTTRTRIRRETAVSYVRRIVVNEVRNHIQREQTQHQRRDARARDRSFAPADVDVAVQGIRRMELVTYVNMLSTQQRITIALRFLLDLTEAETAAAMHTSLGSVKANTSRGLKRLRALMRSEDEAS